MGWIAFLSSMRSPRRTSSSSPTGVSMESGSLASLRTFRTFSTGMPSFSASSSGVGSRPISLSIFRDVRMILLTTSTMCTGMRMVRAWRRPMTNATYDLSTGVGRAPDPRDLITKKTACGAAPAGTPHPLWSAFLDRITSGTRELQGFLQRYIGYCCTGLTSEHVFVFAYGTGANGKSTFINTIVGVLGDYATTADMGTFIASNTERHPTDLAKLRG